jgi:hypothetical protein
MVEVGEEEAAPAFGRGITHLLQESKKLVWKSKKPSKV